MDVRLPDGTVIQNVPDGISRADLTAKLAANGYDTSKLADPAAPAAPSWSSVPGQALSNLPSSAGNFVGGIWQAVRHPLDTAGNVLDIGAGALRNALPTSISSAIDSIDPGQNAAANQQRISAAADATGQFFKNRYGSSDALKNTLATDPVGVASDAATVLTGGGALASKLPMLAKAGKVAQVAGDVVNPVNVATKAAKGVMALPKVGDAIRAVPGAIGNGIAAGIGNLGTHTGAESIKAAYQAGQAGGKQAQTLASNMRGEVPMTDVLAAAKANLQTIGQQKAAAYRQGMAQVSNDKTSLSFAPIDQALADAGNIGVYHDQVLNPRAAQLHSDISAAVDNWKNLDPTIYHTPEGFDALKKQIGGMIDSVPMEEKTAQLVGGNIYDAVKGTITQQAPVYADVMKQYSDATEQIREIERTLSLGRNASVDTALRKLQSLTRNNAQTNYGNRLNLAQQMEQQGGRQIMPALAGQALAPLTPRGMGNIVAAPSGLAGYSAGGPLGAAGVLALQSPRLMGEAALAAGKGAAAVKKASALPKKALDAMPISGADLTNYLYQLGRLPQRP